jgi:hypothetical protein
VLENWSAITARSCGSEEIDRISDTNASAVRREPAGKLGQVYRHFLAQGVKIKVNNRKVARYDPLMLDHPATEIVLRYDARPGRRHARPSSRSWSFPTSARPAMPRPTSIPHNSGFYVVRNGREIIAGETFGFYRHHHSYSHFRAELSYTGNSTVFHEDVKKASIHPDDRCSTAQAADREVHSAERASWAASVVEQAPLNLSHKAAEETINAKLAAKLGNEQPARPRSRRRSRDKGKAEATNGTPRVRFAEMPLEARGRIFHARAEGRRDGRVLQHEAPARAAGVRPQAAAGTGRNFNDPQDRTASANVVGRPFLSIYSVIRRYDTRINKAVGDVVQQHTMPATAGAL